MAATGALRSLAAVLECTRGSERLKVTRDSKPVATLRLSDYSARCSAVPVHIETLQERCMSGKATVY